MSSNSLQGESAARRLVMLRGLPSCGMTTRARELVRTGGTLIEFDEYFYTQVGDDPSVYNWSVDLGKKARAWNRARISQAIRRSDALIVLDDHHGLGKTAQFAARAAHAAGYRIEFAEPTSAWWQIIKKLLQEPERNRAALESWAQKLALLNRSTHRVSYRTFLNRMRAWHDELSVEQLLKATQNSQPSTSRV